MADISKRTLAFSPERMREALWRNVAMPPELAQKAWDRLNEQLDATYVRYYSFQGHIVSKKVTPDNMARMAAIKAVLELADAYPKAKDTGKSQSTTLRINPETGEWTISVGEEDALASAPPAPALAKEGNADEVRQLLPGQPAHTDIGYGHVQELMEESRAPIEFERVHIPLNKHLGHHPTRRGDGAASTASKASFDEPEPDPDGSTIS